MFVTRMRYLLGMQYHSHCSVHSGLCGAGRPPRASLAGLGFAVSALPAYAADPVLPKPDNVISPDAALDRLINREWRTNTTFEYEAGKNNMFHGFYGDYDLEIKTDCGIFFKKLKFYCRLIQPPHHSFSIDRLIYPLTQNLILFQCWVILKFKPTV